MSAVQVRKRLEGMWGRARLQDGVEQALGQGRWRLRLASTLVTSVGMRAPSRF
jgi:hypothetical protein